MRSRAPKGGQVVKREGICEIGLEYAHQGVTLHIYTGIALLEWVHKLDMKARGASILVNCSDLMGGRRRDCGWR